MLEELLINTRCDTAARYLIYSRVPLATPSMGVYSLGLIINGCLQPSAGHFRLARPITRRYCPCFWRRVGGDSSSRPRDCEPRFVAHDKVWAQANIPLPRVGLRRQPGRGRGRRRLFVVLPQIPNVDDAKLGLTRGHFRTLHACGTNREITLSLGDIWELSVPPKEDL